MEPPLTPPCPEPLDDTVEKVVELRFGWCRDDLGTNRKCTSRIFHSSLESGELMDFLLGTRKLRAE